MKNNHKKIEQKILLISFIMGMLSSMVEFIVAIVIKSQSVLMDAAYDAAELVVIGLTLCLTRLFHKPISEKHPFGFTQVESVFIVIKYFMMISVTVGLLSSTIQVMLSGGNITNNSFIAIFQFVLALSGFAALIMMKRYKRKTTTPLIDFEIYGWKIDIFFSLGLSLAFFISLFLEGTKFAPILPYFDQIMAIIIVLCMIPGVIGKLLAAMRKMFLFAPDSETIETIKENAKNVLRKYEYLIDSCEVYYTGSLLWTDVYFRTQEQEIIVKEFESARKELQTVLSNIFPNCNSQLVLIGQLTKKNG